MCINIAAFTSAFSSPYLMSMTSLKGTRGLSPYSYHSLLPLVRAYDSWRAKPVQRWLANCPKGVCEPTSFVERLKRKLYIEGRIPI